MLEKLDKLEERINHFFTKGKNANERCFDFFLRAVTFFIILLAILTYGGLVHASTSVDTNDYDTMNQQYFFTYTELNEHYSGSNPSTVYPIINQGFLDSYPPLWSQDLISNYENQISAIALNNESSIIGEDYQKYYALFLQLDTGVSEGLCRCNLISIYSKDVPLIINDGDTVFNSSLNHWYIYSEYPYVINNADFQINYANQYLPFQLKGNTKTEVSEGGIHVINGNTTAYLFGCDCGVYSLMYSNYYTGNTSSTKIYSSVTDMVNAIISDTTEGKPFNLNPYASIINPEPDPEPTESNANHMSFNDVQIGISSIEDGQNLENASFVIGIKASDWIMNHIDEYNVEVTYQIDGKYRNQNAWNPPFTYNEVMPIKTFTNGLYIKAIRDVYVGSGFASSQHYEHLYDSQSIKSSNTYNGSFPVINGGSIVNKIGSYAVKLLNENGGTEQGVYILEDYSITVKVRLYATGVENPSGYFAKKFDFVRGTESITDAKGLQNENPWTGPTEEQVNPNVPIASDKGGVIQNNTQTVTIYNNNAWENSIDAVGDDNKKGTENLLDAMNNMKQVFAEISNDSDDPEQKGFIQYLGQVLINFPGIEYIVWCVTIVFSLLIVCFFIKAIFL